MLNHPASNLKHSYTCIFKKNLSSYYFTSQWKISKTSHETNMKKERTDGTRKKPELHDKAFLIWQCSLLNIQFYVEQVP
jgi:hypothetical protein